jgi:hypothetical protein
MQSNQSTMFQLGYLGLLPFIGGLVLLVLNETFFDLSGQQVFISYSAVILSFLSGVLWGAGLESFRSKLGRAALVFSNLFALIAWAALLLDGHSKLAVALLTIGFLSVWFTEKHIRTNQKAASPEGYQTMRNRLTIGVVAMHLIFLMLA